MSNILRGPGWANREIINERLFNRETGVDVPGWNRGNKLKDYIEPGMQLPTTGRTAGKTTYREAELLFFDFLAKTLHIDRRVIKTKEVKDVAAGITPELLHQNGYEDVQALFGDWKAYLQDN